MKVIIYQNEDGGMSVVIPTSEILETRTIEEVANKDVPEGKPFKIVDEQVVPKNREDRSTWLVPESELTDGYGSASNEFEVNQEDK